MFNLPLGPPGYPGTARAGPRGNRLVRSNSGPLLIIVTAMRKLLTDDYFRTLLRNEEIPDMPKPLADRILGETP